MKLRSLFGMGLALVLSTAVYAAEGDAKPEAKPDVKGVRLTKPYSELKDLTPEQTTKLKEIHKKYLADLKVLEAKQTEEANAILTDDQKKEIAAMPATGKKPAKAGGDKPADKPAADTGGAKPDAGGAKPDAK